MLKTLPFNALRTLESVVRLRGFGRAAEELNVTQSAVSQHVKMLEGWLGQKLLFRRGRQTVPTVVGAELAAATQKGFGAIEALCDSLRQSKPDNRGVVVASPPGFAFVWLLPRLLRFDEQHPEHPVSLSTDPQSRDPSLSEADVFIAYSAGGFPGLHAERLMAELMTPVCTPAIAERIKSPGDLAQRVILQDDLETEGAETNWQFWAKETETTLPDFPRTRKFGQANLVIQAAVQGLGVAMGRSPLVADAIERGELTMPFPARADSQFAYWLVCRHEALADPAIQAFRKWIHSEVAASPQL